MKEYIVLFFLRIKVGMANFWEWIKVVYLYYGNKDFAKADLLLYREYFFCNPYRMCRQELEKQGRTEIYTYGETPLTTMQKIAKLCKLGPEDTVIELGMGRGRTCFWLALVLKCQVIGIEKMVDFVSKAQSVKDHLQIPNLQFLHKDFFSADLRSATCIYLYGTCMDEEEICELAEKLAALPKGVKVITVSYPLTEYGKGFTLLSSFSAPFTWGTADVYLQVVG